MDSSRFFHAEDAEVGTLAKYISENVSGNVDVIMTDEFSTYPSALKRAGFPASKHKTIEHKQRRYVDGNIHTNTVESAFSLLKRGIVGTWHRVSAKHLPAYLCLFSATCEDFTTFTLLTSFRRSRRFFGKLRQNFPPQENLT